MGSGASRSSEKVTLYVFHISPPCRAVLLAAKMLNVPYEEKVIDLIKGEQNSEEFLKINPDHCVPTLVSNEFRLWESRAILRYLVDTYAPGHELYPNDPARRALIDRFLFYDATASERVNGFMRPQIINKEPPNPEKQQEVEKVLDYLEKALASSKTKYLTGDTLTIADISVRASISMLELNQWDFSRWPKLHAWRGVVEKVTYYQEVNKPLADFAAQRKAA